LPQQPRLHLSDLCIVSVLVVKEGVTKAYVTFEGERKLKEEA